MEAYQFKTEPQSVPLVETAHRKIRSAIPAPGTMDYLAVLAKYESRSMQGQIPIVWDQAKDFSITDIAGNRFIDFTSTIFVTNIGHANPSVLKSVDSVFRGGLIHSYAYANRIRAEYLRKLVEFKPADFEKAFLLSAGTEATEAAVKLMRMYGQKNGKQKLGILAIEGNWHGRTMGAQLLSSNQAQKKWVGLSETQVHHVPFPYSWKVDEKSAVSFFEESMTALRAQGIDPKKDLCGVMLETFQGWGAVFYPVAYVQLMRKFCDENGLLLCFDEMQAGFARTGKMFGYQHYGVKPDLICVGKGMGSGFPISGVLGSQEIMDLPEVGNMSSTHSANPVVCAAALATLQEIEEKNLVEESRRKGELLHARLEALRKKYPQWISSVQGKGMIAAVIFSSADRSELYSAFTSQVAERCYRKGLLVVHTGRESIKIGPPLTITDEALIEGVSVLEEAIGEAANAVQS